MADDSTIPQFNLQALNLVDEICDEFESIWKTGSTPSIAEYLKKTAPDLRPTLFEQLVRVDIDYRRSLGEVPFAEEYVENFPQFRPLLDSIEGLSFCDQSDRLKLLRDIGPLRLLHEIGSGTFGVVWKAHDWNLDRTVAVKLPKSLTLNREHAMSFRHEAKAAAKLNHPGIVRVLSFGLHDGIAYIVYDLVDGLTLKQWATQNSVTPEQAAEICALLADALQHAHDNGVIHRDLKPGNILIEDKSGQPKITDFGLAKRTDSGSTITSYGAIIGTLAYLSPEQASSQHDDLDGRTDIYSLGVILYELLTGRIPFSGSRPEVINKILSSAPGKISPSENIPPRLEQICLKCLAKTVDQRYATARDLANDLREFLSGNNSPLTIKKENPPPSDYRHHRCRITALAGRRKPHHAAPDAGTDRTGTDGMVVDAAW